MLLAEALAERADAQRRLAQLQVRAVANARYQEGETPSEDAAALLAAAEAETERIASLVRRINRTNAATELTPGRTITDAIAERDALQTRHRLLVAVADAAAGKSGEQWSRQLRSELRNLTDLPVPALRERADEIAKQHRLLDTSLQSANWATELLE